MWGEDKVNIRVQARPKWDGQKGLCKKIHLIKGLVARGELPKGLVAEYSGRAHSKGKVGGSWAFPENSKAVYPEQRKPKRGKSRGRGPGSGCNLLTYVVPSSGPAHDTGILIQETNKKKKKKKRKIWPLYCPESPPGNSDKQPGLEQVV